MIKLLKNKNIMLLLTYIIFSKMIFDRQVQMIVIGEVKGIDGFHIGLLESLLLASTFILEVPSGFIADFIGYRTSLILSRIFMLLYSLVMLASQNYAQLSFAFICYGVVEALTSGTEDVFIYKHVSEDTLIYSTNSLVALLSKISGLVSILLGAALMSLSWKAVYFATVIGQSISLVSLFFIKHDRRETRERNGKNIMDEFTYSMTQIKLLFKNKDFILILLSTMICDSVYSILLVFYPVILRLYDYSFLSMAMFSTFGVVAGMAFFFFLSNEKNARRAKPLIYTFVLRCILGIASVIPLITNVPIAVLGTIFILVTLVNIYSPTTITLINTYLISEIRASANSMVNAAQTLFMFLIVPLSTTLLDNKEGILIAFISLAVAFFASAGLLLPIMGKTNTGPNING